MKIKPHFLILFFCAIGLSGCLESVPDDANQLPYGQFSTSPEEQQRVQDYLSEIIDFNGSQPEFADGYSLTDHGTSNALYLGVYHLQNVGLSPKDWASQLQRSPANGSVNKNSWTIAEDHNAQGATVFRTATVDLNGTTRTVLAALKVEYSIESGTYWFYLAIPDTMLKAKDDPTIINLFQQYLNSK